MSENPSSATITISTAHSPKRAIAGRDMLTELGYEDATIQDAQMVFNAMLYVPGSPPEYHSYDEQIAFETRLLMLIAEIRHVTGVGQKPMLTELAGAIADEITRLRADLEKAKEALRPFLREAEGTTQLKFSATWPDSQFVNDGYCRPTWGDLRRAAATLKEIDT